VSRVNAFDEASGEGLRLFQQQRFGEAAEAFARAAEAHPTDFRPHEMMGCSHGSAGRWQECADAFDRAHALGHECVHCRYNCATALVKLERADDALAELDRAIALDPNSAAAWYDRANILGMAHGRREHGEPFDGRHERAVLAFDRVLELVPNAFGALYGRAYTLYKISHSSTARNGLQALGITYDPGQEALATIERALELQPGEASATELRDRIREWLDGG
jgi:tetratricopeptide (TPR) repeat protein